MRKLSKFLSILVIFTLVLGAFTGCAEKDTNRTGDDAAQSHTTEQTRPETAGDSEAKPQAEQQAERSDTDTDKNVDSEKLYTDYINNEVSAIFPSELFSKQEREDNTLRELISVMSASYQEDYLPSVLTDASWAVIDCGDDGEPELALSLTFDDGKEYGSGPLTQYIIMKDFGGELRYVTDTYSYYRVESTLNPYGYYTCGGSNSASSYSFDSCAVTAAGENVCIYSCTTEMGLAEAVIPHIYLPEEQAGGSDMEEEPILDGNGYSVEIYNFPEREHEDYDLLLRDAYYVFYDTEGNNVMPEEGILTRYIESGLHVVTEDEINGLIKAQEEKYGVTEEIKSSYEIDWARCL